MIVGRVVEGCLAGGAGVGRFGNIPREERVGLVVALVIPSKARGGDLVMQSLFN